MPVPSRVIVEGSGTEANVSRVYPVGKPENGPGKARGNCHSKAPFSMRSAIKRLSESPRRADRAPKRSRSVRSFLGRQA
jgi:hypothetical protein